MFCLKVATAAVCCLSVCVGVRDFCLSVCVVVRDFCLSVCVVIRDFCLSVCVGVRDFCLSVCVGVRDFCLSVRVGDCRHPLAVEGACNVLFKRRLQHGFQWSRLHAAGTGPPLNYASVPGR